MTRVTTLLFLVLSIGASPAIAQRALPDLTLEELMGLDAGRVFGASDRLQPVTEAPASVSFVTAEDIARFGHRTLADVLRGVRGVYVSDDRNFSLLGIRGFGKPGDYNSRILLLVNGHRVNDNVFGQAEIGAEFGIDPAMFERVEIIRGPASALYGDSAFFAVINVITKTGASMHGATMALEGGSLGRSVVRTTGGKSFANGVDVALSGTYERSSGVDRLYFPAFDTPATNNGVARGLDGQRVGQLYAQLAMGHVTFTGAYGTRRKDVPTASFGTTFNEQQFREETTDRHTLADLVYRRSFGKSHVTVRGSYDQFSVDGTYPLSGADGEPLTVFHNVVLGSRWSAGTKLTRAFPGRQTVTAGAEFIDNIHQDQQTGIVGLPDLLLDAPRSSVQGAIYALDEIKFGRWIMANAGLRYDHYEAFPKVTPRAAVVVAPSAGQAFKYLYGEAFRAPSAYERNTIYFGENTLALRPEIIRTHELVWERYTRDWLRTSASTYWYRADGLITLVLDPSTFQGTTYINSGHVRAKGLELEAQMRLGRGVSGQLSYALQRTEDLETGTRLANSPAHVATARVSASGPWSRSSVSLEVLFLSHRQTLAMATLSPAATASISIVMPMGRTFELVGGVRNLLNAQYSDPASADHRQDAIVQNGRTLNVGLTWKVGAK
ncbi:MAG: TonB-dependent receptor [Acidobacteriota bacterium]